MKRSGHQRKGRNENTQNVMHPVSSAKDDANALSNRESAAKSLGQRERERERESEREIF